MGKWKTYTLGEINCYKGSSINPVNSPDTTYELYSVPSWDNKFPEIAKGKDVGSTKQSVNKNDVLLCKINPRINRVWVVGQYTENQLIASSEWIIIRNEQLFSKYLYYYLQSPKFRDLLISEQSGIGGSLTRAQPKRVATYPVLIPPLDVQKKIADVLDKASALIDLRRAQLDKLDLLIKSQFIEMFGDPATNIKRWPMYSIGELTDSIEAGECLNGEARLRKDREKAVLKVSAVTYGYFKPDECKVLLNQQDIRKNVTPKKGDLLFSRANTRELVAATAIVDRDYPDLLLPDKLWKLNLNGLVTTKYMKLALSTKSARNYFSGQATGTSGSMFNVSMGKLSNLRIGIPPLELQNQFDAFAQQVDQSKFSIQQSLSKLELNYKSLMQKCFRGEVF